MKRANILGIITLSAAVVASSAACSSTKDESTGGGTGVVTQPSTSESSAAPEIPLPTKASKNYNITFIQGVQGDAFYISMQCGIQEEAAKLGVTVNTQGPQKFDPTLQKPIFDSAVNAKPDAILIAPTDVKAMQAPLQAAAANTKIVLVDTSTEDPSYAVSAIASDNEGGGKAAFDAIKQLAPQGGKVLAISVDPGISTTDARVKGFSEAAAADGKYPYVGVQYSHNDPATAAQLVTAALQKDPDIVGVFAANLFAAQGSATGIQQAGKKGKVSVIGFDAGPDQVKALKDGTVQALIAQQPGYIGKVGLGEAVAALDGGQVTKKVQTGFSIITQQNIDGDQKDAAYKASC
ncbi:ABC transporter substrate-binding protein [Actinoplanes sp. NBRC 103695]|uniref:ABC transporter substrate-binding protein n=1 Tax=Actinoplanes sp. NBRC 103695 TaxID=3032202 RepID=UPI0024A37B26|nr:ABC transporter substrate-binding protein [Actinoplanes sp. NBRC 103695]GLY95802.1 ribose ABC transporter substrate-binding protein [Actinoplanes sp. NBRC 103695]